MRLQDKWFCAGGTDAGDFSNPGGDDASSARHGPEAIGAASRLDTFINRAASHADILAVVRSGPLAVARGVPVLAATT